MVSAQNGLSVAEFAGYIVCFVSPPAWEFSVSLAWVSVFRTRFGTASFKQASFFGTNILLFQKVIKILEKQLGVLDRWWPPIQKNCLQPGASDAAIDVSKLKALSLDSSQDLLCNHVTFLCEITNLRFLRSNDWLKGESRHPGVPPRATGNVKNTVPFDPSLLDC